MRCGMRDSADLLFKSFDGVAFSVGSIFFPHSSPLPLCEIMSACRQRAQFRLPMFVAEWWGRGALRGKWQQAACNGVMSNMKRMWSLACWLLFLYCECKR